MEIYNQRPDQSNTEDNHSANRRRKAGGFYVILPFLAVMLVQNAVSTFLAEVGVFYRAATFRGSTYADFFHTVFKAMTGDGYMSRVLATYAAVCIVWFGIWYAREFLANENPKRDYRCLIRQYRHWSWMLIPGILLFIAGAQYVMTYFMNSLGAIFPSLLRTYISIIKNAGLGTENTSVLMMVYAVILGPICEELTFRGLTFGYARRANGFWAANIMQALLFGMLHMNFLQGAMAFLLGLLFGYIMEKTQNLTLVMLLHIGFNGMSTFLPGAIVSPDSPVQFFLAMLGGMIATYFSLILIVRATQNKFVEVN